MEARRLLRFFVMLSSMVLTLRFSSSSKFSWLRKFGGAIGGVTPPKRNAPGEMIGNMLGGIVGCAAGVKVGNMEGGTIGGAVVGSALVGGAVGTVDVTVGDTASGP